MTNYSEFIAHIIKCYPFEACGLIVGGTFIPCENTATSPTDSFRIDPDMQAIFGDSIEMIVHSHIINPDSPVDSRTPSKEDMDGQVATDVEWGICATDGINVLPLITFGNPKNRPPLLEREFIFNAQDCFSLCTDWMYQNRGVILPEVPRDWFWQTQGLNPFIDLFESFGFHEVQIDDIKEGDWVLFNRRAPEGVCNHAAIYIGDDQMMHHEFRSLSCVDTLYRHRKYILKIIRHKDEV